MSSDSEKPRPKRDRRVPFDDLPQRTVYRATCPLCNGWKITTQRTVASYDGDVTRYMRCDNPACRARFKLFVVVPDPLPKSG